MTTKPTSSFSVAFYAPAYPGYRGEAHADVYEDRIVWWREEIGPSDYNQFPVAEQTRAEFEAHGPPIAMERNREEVSDTAREPRAPAKRCLTPDRTAKRRTAKGCLTPASERGTARRCLTPPRPPPAREPRRGV